MAEKLRDLAIMTVGIKTSKFVNVVVQFGFWFNFDFPLFDIHYHILA